MSSVVYSVHGPKGKLLYIGSTNNLTARMRQHRTSGPVAQWIEVNGDVEFRVLGTYNSAEASVMEVDMIIKRKPPLNTAYKGANVRSIFARSDRRPHSKALDRERKANFPLVFWDDLRDRAEAIAASEHGGNLTALVNTAVKTYVERFEKKGKR